MNEPVKLLVLSISSVVRASVLIPEARRISTVNHTDIGYENGGASSPAARMEEPGLGARGTTSYGQAVANMDHESDLISGRPCD